MLVMIFSDTWAVAEDLNNNYRLCDDVRDYLDIHPVTF
jgi:hypothetical protein